MSSRPHGARRAQRERGRALRGDGEVERLCGRRLRGAARASLLELVGALIDPAGEEGPNLKKSFSAELGETERYGMAGALVRVGLPLVGTHHRGIDDARNIARLLPWCHGRARAPEPARPQSVRVRPRR